MAGADEGYIPRPETRGAVFGDGSRRSPYFENDGVASGESVGNRHVGAEDDVRLPWLEGDEDDFEEPRGGVSQGVLLGALGVVALLLIAGGVVWAIKSQPSPTLVADGGVIAAPKAPYKVKPENPGGEIVAGTGDTSFAVAEGQSRAPQIDKSAGPADAVSSASVAGTPPAGASAPAAVGGVGVQVGAYATQEQAEAGWTTLKSQYEPLNAMGHRIVQGRADIGTVYRLQAVPGDGAAARALCSGMKKVGMSCQVKN